MKALLRSDKGIVLVTSLMLTLISLVVVMALFYLMTTGTKISSAQKRYRTALDASYGGAELVAKDIIPLVLKNYSSGSTLSVSLNSLVGSSGSYSGLGGQGLQISSQSCLQKRLKNDYSAWAALGCTGDGLPAFKSPDLTFTLQAASGNPFTVYSKIMSTRAGNSDMGGLSLIGGSVADASNIIYPQSQPYLYTIEVQGQRQNDSTVSSDLEVLYAY